MNYTTLGAVEPFNPDTDEWLSYEERLEQFFLANEIADERKKIAVFLTVIDTKKYTLLTNLVAPEKTATKMYIELVAALKAHLNPKPLVIAEIFKFHCRYQKEEESIAQYIAELRKLANIVILRNTYKKPSEIDSFVEYRTKRLSDVYLQKPISPYKESKK